MWFGVLDSRINHGGEFLSVIGVFATAFRSAADAVACYKSGVRQRQTYEFIVELNNRLTEYLAANPV
ncbi:hypothetical protein FRUB_05341 [Fimbriiglobus ruber]|uniref:Uncharacterized protein n=2 Tax=Fimbriiglobus ruber TaxID=1908690 RepID=A0A225DG08_9BACT|nr:hypothetical protein FRUB_05341 [Fimbriiglobus ruber]